MRVVSRCDRHLLERHTSRVPTPRKTFGEDVAGLTRPEVGTSIPSCSRSLTVAYDHQAPSRDATRPRRGERLVVSQRRTQWQLFRTLRLMLTLSCPENVARENPPQKHPPDLTRSATARRGACLDAHRRSERRSRRRLQLATPQVLDVSHHQLRRRAACSDRLDDTRGAIETNCELS